MSLVTRGLPRCFDEPPADVGRFLREARRRIARFGRERHAPAFVPSDFGSVYAALGSLEESGLLEGRWFCEWGSGFGVVSCLAAMLGLDARGIEADGELVEAARRLAADFGLAAEFAHGNFVPEASDVELGGSPGLAWLSTGGRDGHKALGVGVEELDLIFAYPWPDEEGLVRALFERHARPGALLLTDHWEGDSLSLHRKVAGPGE
jgi:hypothetical protein